ncbi:MAG: lactate racemase domain-containing protein [Chloroflexota bacterium]
MQIELRWRSWYGDEPLLLDFPDRFAPTLYPPRGGLDIGEEGIRRAFANPIGSPRLAQLARGKKSAVVVVDDIARPTPAYRIIPTVLDELHEAGVPDANIKFLLGIACHRAMIRADMVKKLGQAVVDRYEIINHHPYENLVHYGETSHQSPVYVDRHYAEAEVRVAIGQIAPHGGPGFSGGAKLIFPGVAGIQFITANHKPGRLKIGLLKADGNELRDDIEEAARMVGLDLIANVVLNPRREIAGLFVGDMIAAHRAGVQKGFEVMETPLPKEAADVGVFNQYPKDTEFMHLGHALHVMNSAARPLVREGGTVVILSASSDGLGYHSLEGPYMRHEHKVPNPRFAGRNLVIMCGTANHRQLPASLPANVRLVPDWAGVLAALAEYHPQGGRVAVFPCGAIQLAEERQITSISPWETADKAVPEKD